ncbi:MULTISPECIES: putative T7SS-secreted protein [unclassified Streptomyces]|uniref:putative T7SS-secreted protein n=1 Tax=unclassified Streptomyces TaxID=2593676 RepID=UPI0024429267|nr:toxin glutamine deamidase domain-containing protein [Streptomyces sp. DH41]MDG9727613.1 toxin glutamine deamidase domain-containing protein [Streptomyces sp. DH41]
MGVLDDIGSGLGKLEDGVNHGLNLLEDGVDAGKKIVGEGIDWGTDRLGEGLDKVGLEGAADTVEDWGDEVASDLGATPGEQQLGQTEEANELLHGNPEKIRSSAKHLRDFSTAFDKVGTGMKKVDSTSWRGEGGDTFREKFGVHPAKWLHAADACETAATALDSYAGTVKWAQQQAQEAIELYRRGKRASEKAIEDYNKQVDAYNAKLKADQDPGPVPQPFHDPGKETIKQARDKLAQARKQRNSAASEAEGSIKKALEHAPAEPPPLDRIGNNLVDGFVATGVELNHVAGGVIKGTAGLVSFARGLNPADPYNLTHPAEYLQNVSMTLSGLVSTAAHPERALNAAVEGFKKDPSEFIGRLLPELIGTKGAGLARGGLRMAVKEGVETGAGKAASGTKLADDVAGAAPKDWSDLARSTDHVKEKAVHAESVDPKKAQEFLDDQFPWLKDVNNTGMPGYTDNCSHNVVTVDRRMDDIDVSAAPRQAGGHIPPEQLGAKDRVAGQYDWVNSYDDVIRDLQGRGEGSRSVVYIARPNGSAHVFNAVNTPDGVVFLDGQSGTLGLLEQNVTHIGHIPYRDGVK